MERTLRYRGVQRVVPVVPIPFVENGEIDEGVLRNVIEFAVSCGVSAVCLPAYGSEFYKLSEAERTQVVGIAVEQAAGRLCVIAQSNHGSTKHALRLAKTHIEAGADIISVAIPRLFALSDDDITRYLEPILNGVELPCLVQDFNPGGPCVSAGFVARLRSACPNFRYLKLEEPMMAAKVQAIRETTNGQIGILEGWGGLYMMELIPAGICGIMPGLALADLLNLIFDLRRDGKANEAFECFQKVLPLIVFSLQNLELYLYCEKRFLQARGVLDNHCRRSAAYTPDSHTERYVDELNERILRAIEEAGLTTAARTWH